jgi:adenosylhomocysteine nucleosidase
MTSGQPPRLAVITALKEELSSIKSAIDSVNVLLIRGGVGSRSAASAAESAIAAHPRTIVSSGFCGGLLPGPQVGHVVVATRVLDGSGEGTPIDCDKAGVKQWLNLIEKAGVPCHSGDLTSVSAAVTSVAAKAELARRSGAIAVDMESYAIASLAQKAGIPFLLLRSISDSSDDALPPEVGGFLDENGNVRAGQVAKFAIKGPRNIKMLMTLKSRSDKAVAGLTSAWQSLSPFFSGTNN